MRKPLTLAGIIITLGILGAVVWNLTLRVAPIIATNGRAVLISENVYALYLDIENTGSADTISGIHTPLDGTLSIMGVESGLSPVIPTESKASFSSDGAHIMFHGKGEELEPGMFIPLSLNFANAGEIPVKVLMNDGNKTRARNGQNGAPMDHSMHGSANGAHLTDYLMHEMGAPLNVKNLETAPALTMMITEENGRTVSVSLATSNFRFVEPVEEATKHIDGEGHGHLYLNGLKLQRMYTPNTTIGGLPAGRHQISVSLNTNDHRVYAVNGAMVESKEYINIDE